MSTPPRPTQPLTGYSAQARISLEVAELINNGRLRFWFATSINPRGNDLSSNPLEIFAQLERVTKRSQLKADAEKVQSLLSNLATWVFEAQSAGESNANQAALLIRDASSGQLDLLEPAMYELRDIIPERCYGDDEFTVENEPISEKHRVDSYSLRRLPSE